MIFVLGRKRLEWWPEPLGPVLILGNEVGFCAVDHISSGRAVLRRFSAIATFYEPAHEPSVLSLGIAGWRARREGKSSIVSARG